jgi:hypothetical protein
LHKHTQHNIFSSKMTITHLLSKADVVSDVGVLVQYIAHQSGKAGQNTIHALKFILFDTTVAINKLPFGNWISIAYFIIAASAVKNVIEGGEMVRLANRAINVYFVERQNLDVLISRFYSYLYRSTCTLLYDAATWAWGHSGEKVKRGVSKFAKEVVMDNADEIERRAVELAKGAALTAVIATATQKIVAELGPIAFEAFQHSNQCTQAIEYLTYDMQSMTSQLETQNDELIAKINGISLQLEYLKETQPDKFHAILSAISATIPLSVIETLLPSRQTNRKRIESI